MLEITSYLIAIPLVALMIWGGTPVRF